MLNYFLRRKKLSIIDKLIFGHIYFKSTLAIFLNISKIAYWEKFMPFKGRWIQSD